jgi:hypothetical protein
MVPKTDDGSPMVRFHCNAPGYAPDCIVAPPPLTNFASCFTSLAHDPPHDQLDCHPGVWKVLPPLSQQFPGPPGTPIVDLNEIENRSLLATNVDPDTPDDEIQSLFNPFNDTRSIDTSLLDFGSLLVAYFDPRHANQVRRSCNNAMLHGTAISVVYAPLAKIDDPRTPPNNRTIVVFHLPPRDHKHTG